MLSLSKRQFNICIFALYYSCFILLIINDSYTLKEFDFDKKLILY